MKLPSFASIAQNETQEPAPAREAGRRLGMKGFASSGGSVFADLLRPRTGHPESSVAGFQASAGTAPGSPAAMVSPAVVPQRSLDRSAAERDVGGGQERRDQATAEVQPLGEPESVGGRATPMADRASSQDGMPSERGANSAAGHVERSNGRRTDESTATLDQLGGRTEGRARQPVSVDLPKPSVPQSLGGKNVPSRHRSLDLDARASAGRVMGAEHQAILTSQGPAQPVVAERGKRASSKLAAVSSQAESVLRQSRIPGRSSQHPPVVASQAAATGEAFENRTSTQRPSLDPQKWSIHSTRQQSRSGQEGAGRESRQQNRDLRNEVSLRTEGARPMVRAAAPAEVESGVRDGLNQLVRKAHVLIGQGGETSAQIRMNPDHLGFMSVDMKVQNNQVVLRILVDREDVLEQLKKDLEILRGDFAKSGLQMESVSLKLRESFDTAFQRDGESRLSQSSQEPGHEAGREPGKDSAERRPPRQDGHFEPTVQAAGSAEKPEPEGILLRGESPREVSGTDYDRLLVMNTSARERRVFSA